MKMPTQIFKQFKSFTLSYQTGIEIKNYEIKVIVDTENIFQHNLLKQLFASEIIHNIEEKNSVYHEMKMNDEEIQKLLLDYSLQYGVMCSKTAFVVVDTEKKVNPDFVLDKVEVPHFGGPARAFFVRPFGTKQGTSKDAGLDNKSTTPNQQKKIFSDDDLIANQIIADDTSNGSFKFLPDIMKLIDLKDDDLTDSAKSLNISKSELYNIKILKYLKKNPLKFKFLIQKLEQFLKLTIKISYINLPI